MKKLSLKTILIGIVSLTIFVGCSDDDGYSLGKRWEALATVHPIGEYSYYLTLDNGKKLGVAASNTQYKPKQNQRVYLNFTYLSDSIDGFSNAIKVNWLSEILTKDIIDLTIENEDSIGSDPIRIQSLWVGDDYLNIYFGYNAGGQKTHYLNLVNNLTLEMNDNGNIYLELRHNTNNDPAWYGRRGYAAFNLRPYKLALEGLDSVNIIITAKDFDGTMKTHKIKYNLNGNTTSNHSSLTYDSNSDATLFK